MPKFDLFFCKLQQAKLLKCCFPRFMSGRKMKLFAHGSSLHPAKQPLQYKLKLMGHLFEPLRIRDVELAHRIVVSPMCQYSCQDGFATDWHFVHLGSRAVGRAAAVIAEATAVTADGRISPQDLGIWTDAHIEPLRRTFSFVASEGAVP